MTTEEIRLECLQLAIRGIGTTDNEAIRLAHKLAQFVSQNAIPVEGGDDAVEIR